jgi:HD-GYP domain-containing protein (c-di-GMP phosphodiesterase class II)
MALVRRATSGDAAARGPRLSLVARFALVSLVAITGLGAVVAYSLGRSIQSSALQNAQQTALDDLNGPLTKALGNYTFKGNATKTQWDNLANVIGGFVTSKRTVEVKLWKPDGTLFYAATEKNLIGRQFDVDEDLGAALHGTISSDVTSLSDPENRELQKRFGQLFQVYIPVRAKVHGRSVGPVIGAFEIYQVYKPVGSEITMLQRRVYMMMGMGLLVLYVLLYGIVRRGSNTIKRQQRELVGYTASLERSYNETIGSLAAAVDARDSTTERHAERVTDLAVALGRWISMPDEELRDLERGALLHDVGKIGVSDLILLKPGKLTENEWVQMRRHPVIGHEMLQNVSFLQAALPVVRHHHERWDGTGYPDRLRGEWIPRPARLFAVIDVYDALTSDRPYRASMSHEEAMRVLHDGSGSHFDPAMVDAFSAMMVSGVRLEQPDDDLVDARLRREKRDPIPATG